MNSPPYRCPAADGLLEVLHIDVEPGGEGQPVAVANQDLSAEELPKAEDRLAQRRPRRIPLAIMPEQFQQRLSRDLAIASARQIGEHGEDLGGR